MFLLLSVVVAVAASAGAVGNVTEGASDTDSWLLGVPLVPRPRPEDLHRLTAEDSTPAPTARGRALFGPAVTAQILSLLPSPSPKAALSILPSPKALTCDNTCSCVPWGVQLHADNRHSSYHLRLLVCSVESLLLSAHRVRAPYRGNRPLRRRLR